MRNRSRFKIDNPVEKMIKSMDTILKTEPTEDEYVWNIDKATGIFYLLRKSDKGENMKKIFEIYRGYGKFNSMELDSMIVKEDTLENREKIFEDEFGHWDYFDGKENFLNGESNFVDCERYGCDWDEVTCGYIIVTTKEEKLEEIREQYEKNIDEVTRLFEGE
jgi:hypothetical protein